MEFLKKVDNVLSSAQAQKEAEAGEEEKVKNLLRLLCQKAKESSLSLVVFAGERAVRITPEGVISLAPYGKEGGRWRWVYPSLTLPEAEKKWLPVREGLLWRVLASALKNEAEVEVE
jgi:hypothetical protein